MHVPIAADVAGLSAGSLSALVHSAPRPGADCQETCKNKFRITGKGFGEEEAQVRQTLPRKTPWSALAFTAERRKHEYHITIPEHCFLQIYATVQSDTALHSFWSDPFTTKAADNILTNPAAQPCLSRQIYMHRTPYTSACFELDLQNKMHYVLMQHTIISTAGDLIVKNVLKPSSFFFTCVILTICAWEQMCYISVLPWSLKLNIWSAHFEPEHCSLPQHTISQKFKETNDLYYIKWHFSGYCQSQATMAAENDGR